MCEITKLAHDVLYCATMKVLTTLPIILFMVFFLTACGSANKPSSTSQVSDPPETPSSVKTPSTSEPVKVVAADLLVLSDEALDVDAETAALAELAAEGNLPLSDDALDLEMEAAALAELAAEGGVPPLSDAALDSDAEATAMAELIAEGVISLSDENLDADAEREALRELHKEVYGPQN